MQVSGFVVGLAGIHGGAIWDSLDKAFKTRGGDTPAAQRGREAHKDFAEKVKQKPGWQSETPIEGTTKLRPDAIDPKGRPVELKPNTPSGRAQGQKQIEKYKEATGTR